MSRMYQCPDCPRSYCNKKGLSQHRRFECGREREQCCHFCDYRAFRPPQLYRHLRLRHNVEPLLDKDTAFRPSQLYRHLRLRHNVERLLDKDTAFRPPQLYRHLRLRHNVEPLLDKDTAFRPPQLYRRLRLRHNVEPLLDKDTAFRPPQLYRHLRLRHNVEPLLDKDTAFRPPQLYRHLRLRHNVEPLLDKDTAFRPPQLYRHLRLRHNVEPLLDKDTAFRPPQLYRHLRLRHNVEPLLDKDTAFRPPQLYRHLRLRHNVEPLLDKDTLQTSSTVPTPASAGQRLTFTGQPGHVKDDLTESLFESINVAEFRMVHILSRDKLLFQCNACEVMSSIGFRGVPKGEMELSLRTKSGYSRAQVYVLWLRAATEGSLCLDYKHCDRWTIVVCRMRRLPGPAQATLAPWAPTRSPSSTTQQYTFTIYHHIFQNLGDLSPLSKCFGYAPGTLPPPPCLWPFDRLVCVAELHRCPQCGRTYRTLQGWQQHIRLECGKVPGKCCQLCDYKTYYTSHLKRHIVNRHRDLASVVVDDLSNV
ncbi:hypothetical protein J6590_002348 [Homalodisca vitripennis]|nr:hypothetical protein J6590_002348 [Homalodisca vitripennis]